MRCLISLILMILSLAPLAAQDLTAVRELKQLWKYDEAIASLTQMMAEQGPRPELLEELVDCHFQSGNAAEALDQYSLLAQMQPDKLLYQIRLMSLFYRGRQYDGAIEIGRGILQRDSITQVISLVGDAFNQQERRDSAECYYRAALARRPHSESVLNKLCSILLGREQHDEVLALADAFLAEEPDNLTILPVRGIARFAKKRYDDAEADFKHMNELGEDGYAVHYYLGQCAQKNGLLRDAEREFKLAWERDSTDVNVALTIAQLISDARKDGWEVWYDKALTMLQPDPKVISATAIAHQNYALSAYKNGDFDLCIAEYKKMLEYSPKHYAAYYMIAQCYELKKDYKTALSWYKKAQPYFAEGTRGREIADTGIQRMEAELFFLNE
ncbi:MAG: tetratricopeptide repeat protein [Bacteroidales bacterium]|nr:tetratricopeptide repeat protein [Bacteroidales bacterium]